MEVTTGFMVCLAAWHNALLARYSRAGEGVNSSGVVTVGTPYAMFWAVDAIFWMRLGGGVFPTAEQRLNHMRGSPRFLHLFGFAGDEVDGGAVGHAVESSPRACRVRRRCIFHFRHLVWFGEFGCSCLRGGGFV